MERTDRLGELDPTNAIDDEYLPEAHLPDIQIPHDHSGDPEIADMVQEMVRDDIAAATHVLQKPLSGFGSEDIVSDSIDLDTPQAISNPSVSTPRITRNKEATVIQGPRLSVRESIQKGITYLVLTKHAQIEEILNLSKEERKGVKIEGKKELMDELTHKLRLQSVNSYSRVLAERPSNIMKDGKEKSLTQSAERLENDFKELLASMRDDIERVRDQRFYKKNYPPARVRFEKLLTTPQQKELLHMLDEVDPLRLFVTFDAPKQFIAPMEVEPEPQPKTGFFGNIVGKAKKWWSGK